MDSNVLLELAVETLEDLKARDIEVLDVKKFTRIADYLIVASGTSGRHVRSVAERVAEAAKHAGVTPLGIEGKEGSEWVLIDLNDVIVHVMQPSVREFYKLEDLWSVRPSTATETPAD
jgi:ribosome-associated protein